MQNLVFELRESKEENPGEHWQAYHPGRFMHLEFLGQRCSSSEHSSTSISQLLPVNPSLHTQVSGLTQTPPLRHGDLQIAVKNIVLNMIYVI